MSAINDETVVVGAETETEVEAEAEAPLDIDPESIKPFILVEQDKGGMSVILTVGTYKEELFQLRENEGFEGSGYDWASLAAVFLEEQMPELSGTIRFDPEADMFCAYSADRAALQQFAVRFKAACEDDELMKDLFSRAELD
nr:immunity 51 family protein [Paenibacillus donghaensis]